MKKLTLKERAQNVKTVLSYMTSKDKTYFALLWIVALFNVIVPYMSLMLSSYVLDAIADGISFQQILSTVILSLLVIAVIHAIQSYLWSVLEVRREHLFSLYYCSTEEKMLSMSFASMESPAVKELKDRIRQDNNYGYGLGSIFWMVYSFFYQAFYLIFSMAIGAPIVVHLINAFDIPVLLTLLFIIAAIVLNTIFKNHFRKKALDHQYYKWTEDEKKEHLSFCWDFAEGDGFHYKNGKDVRIYGSYSLMEKWTIGHLNDTFSKKLLKNISSSSAKASIFGGLTGTIQSGGAYLLVALPALAGTMSLGNVVLYAGCLSNLMSNAYAFVDNLMHLSMACSKQISTLSLLDLEDSLYRGKLPVEKRSDNQYQIEFRNVSFRYPGTETYALRNVSLKLTIGEKLAIVGMNGSGKTTLIKLLCRLYDPDEGEILLNGVDIRKFNHEEYTQLFSVVFQDYSLFAFPVAQNVAVDTTYDEEKVKKCLADSGWDIKNPSFPKGIETWLYKDYTDEGTEVSGGEAQKIALARAIYKNAPFILLDEPTAALDPIAEYEIYTHFDSIVGDKTAVYISHRLSSCRFCEKIAVFHEGELVQMGNHQTLLKDTDGKYYEMWNAQAQYYQ